MKPVPFTKMSALGNDFIIVDNRDGVLEPYGVEAYASRVCKARYSVGGDQLMVIEKPRTVGDYFMRTINPDGTEVKMCGNASRCVARYAFAHGIAGARQSIETLGGPVEASIEDGKVSVGLQVTGGPELDIALGIDGESRTVHSIEISGAPHAVLYLEGTRDTPGEEIHRLGASIRYNPRFPRGTNVNFIEVAGPGSLFQRTYERGIEGETFACGTGATAAAIVSCLLGRARSPVAVRVVGGDLGVSFERDGGRFERVRLSGSARFVAEGTIHPEALDY
jgi:diaminopimelate epimerase